MIGQINQCFNPPENIESYEFKEREANMYRPRYDTVTGEFLGLHETLGYLTVRGDADQCFFDYGSSKQNFKILHSFHRKRMPNNFSGTLFNRHRTQYESRGLNTKFSRFYLLLLSITDRTEDINRHMGSVNLLPVDISAGIFEVETEVKFDPFKLDYDNPDREKMGEAVFKMFKKVIELSNTNLVKNSDGLLQKNLLSKKLNG